MIDWISLFKVVSIAAAGMIIPGPDFMMISSMALSRGRRAGLLAAAGIAFGVLIYTTLCAFGLGIVFIKLQWLIATIRFCGGVYLIYLGIQLWRASFKASSLDANEEKSNLGKKERHPFLIGFMTNMTNPKALAFFTSVFAVALPPQVNGSTTMTIVIITSIMPIFWFGFVTFGLSTRSMKKVYMRWSKWIDRVSGTFLALFGLRLMFTGNK